jgi:hypothetical protein
MRHLTDGVLRALADHELAEADAVAVEHHLAGCGRCRDRAERIAAGAAAFNALFTPDENRPAPDSRYGFQRFEARRRERESAREPLSWIFSARLWAAAAAATVIIVLTASAPSRAVARKLLGIFRAKTVVAVPVGDEFTANGKGQLISDLLSASVTVTKDEKRQNVAGRREASELAGFPVRLPAVRGEAPRLLMVEGAKSLHFTVDIERVKTFLTLLERPNVALPRELAGAQVYMEVPRGVRAIYGECNDSPAAAAEPWRLATCLDLIQAPSATVTVQPEQDLRQIAEIGLQVTGMTAGQAAAFTRAIDWTSTAVIPLPRESAGYRNVRVDGVEGVLITGREISRWPTRWSLIWVRDERIYSLTGYGDPPRARAIAESLE